MVRRRCRDKSEVNAGRFQGSALGSNVIVVGTSELLVKIQVCDV